MKITKSMYAALAVVAIVLSNPSLAGSKSVRSSDPEVPVMKGVTKTKQYGFMFRRHPLFTSDHALEVQGGTIMLNGKKLTDYRETEGPLVGFYCYSQSDDNGNTVCQVDEGGYMSMDEYASEIVGLRPYVRYSNTFQDTNGYFVEAIIGCSKKFTQKQCEDYVGE